MHIHAHNAYCDSINSIDTRSKIIQKTLNIYKPEVVFIPLTSNLQPPPQPPPQPTTPPQPTVLGPARIVLALRRLCRTTSCGIRHDGLLRIRKSGQKLPSRWRWQAGELTRSPPGQTGGTPKNPRVFYQLGKIEAPEKWMNGITTRHVVSFWGNFGLLSGALA